MGNFIGSTGFSGIPFFKPTTLATPVLPEAPEVPTSSEKATPALSATTVQLPAQGSAATGIGAVDFSPETAPATELKTATKAQVKAAVNKATRNNYALVKQGITEDRHELNQRLQLQDPSKPRSSSNLTRYDGADVVVISFEGTAAFEPRRLQIMQEAAAILKEQGLNSKDLYSVSTGAIEAQNDKPANWSGLNVGVHTEIFKDPELQERAQILSFPSEESELFKGDEVKRTFGGSYVIDALKDGKNPLSKLGDEIMGSTLGRTPGIDNALIAMKDIQTQAQAMGKSPKFVVIGHSSGGRSMVKFLEKAKAIEDKDGNAVKFDLSISIDPMMEAHEAAKIGVGVLAEQGKQWLSNGTLHNINKLNRWLNPLAKYTGDIVNVPEYKEPVVGYTTNTKKQLYVPNNVKPGMSYAFHQRTDKNGLGMGFGIQGVKVAGAQNMLVEYEDQEKKKPLSDDGHGSITYSHSVTELFKNSISGLLRLP